MTESEASQAPSGAGDKLAHLGFVVRDIEKEMKRWAASGAVTFIEPELDPTQMVYCALVGFPTALPFELVAPAAENSPVQARLKKGGGLDHVCLFVDDIDVTFTEYQSRGGLPLVAPVYGVVFDRMIAFVQMRTGLVIELMQSLRENRKPVDPLSRYFAAVS